MTATTELANPFDHKLSAHPSFEEADAFVQRFTNSYSRMPVIVGLYGFNYHMDRSDWLRLLGEWWSCCDNIGAHRLALRRRLPAAGPVPELMTAEEMEAYNALPERLTIYRGCGPSNMLGASWSLERETAARFPFLNRYRQSKPLLVTATVKKSRILAIKLDRGEAELITFSARRVAVEELQQPQALAQGVA
jgi:hypothetical protein